MRRTAVALATAVALSVGGCGGRAAEAKGSSQGEIMSDAQVKAGGALVLKDAEYFGLDNARTTALSLKLSGLFPMEFGRPQAPESFLAVGAPRQVDLDRKQEIPILIGKRYTGRREWDVHFEQNVVVVAVDLKTGQVMTGWPFIMGKRRETPPPSASGDPPKETEAKTVLTGVERLDLRELFERPWITTRIAVSALDYDWRSNVVTMDIVKEGPLPAEAKPRKPSEFLSPGAVAGPGASLEIPAKAAKNAPLLLKGSLDLSEDLAALAPLEGTPGAAVLTASILFRKLDHENSVQIDLSARAEMYEAAGVKRVKAGFALDAAKALPGHVLEGTYQVYLVAGAALSGPYPLTVGP
jgi:hypothetical protein